MKRRNIYQDFTRDAERALFDSSAAARGTVRCRARACGSHQNEYARGVTPPRTLRRWSRDDGRNGRRPHRNDLPRRIGPKAQDMAANLITRPAGCDGRSEKAPGQRTGKRKTENLNPKSKPVPNLMEPGFGFTGGEARRSPIRYSLGASLVAAILMISGVNSRLQHIFSGSCSLSSSAPPGNRIHERAQAILQQLL